MYSELIELTQGIPQYKELEKLAERANIVAILELLTKLRHTPDHKQQDRLYQALVFMATYSPWKKPQGIIALEGELKDPKEQSKAQSLLQELSEVIENLPLVWGQDHYNFASFSDLEAKLFASLSQEEGPYDLWLLWVSAHHYTLVSKHLLKVASVGQSMISINKTNEWLSFLVTSPFLEANLAAYSNIKEELAPLKLPPIPCIRVDDDLWLFSRELILGTLRTYFNMVKKEPKANLAMAY